MKLVILLVLLKTGNFDRLNLAKYNTLILADGYYDFSEEQQKHITEWIKRGKVIAMNNALSIFEDKEAYSLTLLNRKPAKSTEKQASDKLLKERF
jgi:hypothetical protein